MKIVCITGAYGFIGRNVSCLYASKGWHVIGIGHGSWARKEWRKWGISEWHSADITIETMITYAQRPDVIVHCAGSGSVKFSLENPFQDFQRTVSTTTAVLEFIRLYSPKSKLVYPSSAGVYGVVEEQPIKENSPLQPISPYGVHKKMAEDLIISYSNYFNISASIVRLFSIYGNFLRKQLIWDACTKIKNKDYSFYGSGEEIRDWLHIDDTSSLLFAAGCNASTFCPIINGGSGKGITVREILDVVFNTYNCNESPRFIGSPKPGDPVNYIADISISQKLNWHPIKKWQEGIREYVEWFKSQEN